MINYISTRGQAPVLSFEEAVMTGLASDGGLYVPETLPQLSTRELTGMVGLSYSELALHIIRPFTQGAIEENDLRKILQESYAGFSHRSVAPLEQLAHNEYLLELFHGPTLAFKDFALQFLGRVFEYFLDRSHDHITIVGATSGDTGSAAIEGCRGRRNMKIFILHPHNRVSDVQRRQMTTVADENVFNIAVEGTFDDCQDIVKALFADETFRAKQKLTAVNSINWARILAQVVYYFYAALAASKPEEKLSFCVPTGNFGDIYAGYIAKKMGLKIDKLVIATNSNDILARCLKTGTYGITDVAPTISPSMDIQISSNFERLLFDLNDRNPEIVTAFLQDLRKNKKAALTESALMRLRQEFAAGTADDTVTRKTIAAVYKETGELIDPHSAVGVAVAREFHTDKSVPLVTLATAHPAKFPDAVKEATGIHPALPEHLADLMQRKERFEVLPPNKDKIKAYIESKQ